MNLRNQKGINLITLSIAIIILIIITSVLVYNSKDGTKIKTLSNLYNDIESLDKKVSSYYVEHGDLPKLGEYTNTTFISGLDAKQNNPNNGGKYYVIDLKALEGVSLNYGRDYDSVSPTDDRIVALDDIYIINEISHTIYYPKGIDVQNVTYHTKPENWTNISLSIIPIYTAEQLSWVGDGQTHAVNGLNYTFSLDGTYMLKNDIDLSSVCSEASGVSWQPIGDANVTFTGSFYGNGHEIQNMYMNYNGLTPRNPSRVYMGLFADVGNATIKDLGLTGTIIVPSGNPDIDYPYLGGIIGCARDGTNISNCNNNTLIKAESVYNCAGGIIGVIRQDGTVTINNCYNLGNITGGYTTRTAGLVGFIGLRSTATINNCYNKGTISGGREHVAGIVSLVSDNATATITNSYNEGTILGYNKAASGIVAVSAANTALTITNCYNNGEIINTGVENGGTGGILGYQTSTIANGFATINNCQNHNKVKADVYVGGIAGLTRKGTIENCENTGAIEGTAVNSLAGNTGGIVGYNTSAVISKCKNTGEVIANSNCIGGICGTNTGTVKECLNDAKVTVGHNGGGIRWSNRLSKW